MGSRTTPLPITLRHAARNQLQHKLFSVDDDGVAGIVAASIAGNDGEILRQNVDDLAFAFVAPLGADNYGGLASFQCQLHYRDSLTHNHTGVAHALPRQILLRLTLDGSGEDVYKLSYRG